MYKIIFSILNLIICQSLFAITTFIGGHFDNPQARTVTIQYQTSLFSFIENNTTTLELNIDEKNNFMFEIETYNPVKFNLLNGDAWLFINKYILTGDSVWFEFEKNKTNINGRCKDYLTFMFEWESKFMNDPIVNKEYNSSYTKFDAIEFAAYWNKRRKDQLDFFYTFFKNKEVPKNFQHYIEAEINYSYAVAMLQYSWRNKTAKAILKDVKYLKFLDSILVDNPAATISGAYLHFLREFPYNMYKSGIDYDNMNDPVNQNYIKNKIHLRDSIAQKHYTGITYDIALYRILYEEIETAEREMGQPNFSNEYKKVDSVLTLYHSSFNDSFYYNRLIGKLHDLNNPNKLAPDFTIKDINGNDVRLSDFQGKVVYLDFWATNCAPCLAEIPQAIALKEKFKGKDVVFLYISLDHSIDKLKKTITSKSFNGIHLIAPKGFASDVAKLYEINAIPQYFLIDKKGFILNRDAPRPSLHPEVLIEKALH